MIENADKICAANPAPGVKFQQELLAHWRDIQQNRRFPDKRKFRPQKFPKFLPQLAIVSVNADQKFEDRLTGATVAETLRLKGQHDRLVAPIDVPTRAVMQDILGRGAKADGPIYIRGKFKQENSCGISFSALVLPFSHNSDEDILDTLMLAFDFSRDRHIELAPKAYAHTDNHAAPGA